MVSLQEFMDTFNTSYSNLLQFTPKKMLLSSKFKNYVYCIETLVTKFHSSYFANNPNIQTDDIGKFIMENREVKTKESIRHKIQKNI
jgi:hypothetical protein